MTDFLLCVLIATVARGFDILSVAVQSDKKKVEREAFGLIMIAGIVLGSVLYGLLKLAGWLVGEYGSGPL